MKWRWGRLWCIFNWRSFEETRMECFNSIRRRPLSVSPPSCHRQWGRRRVELQLGCRKRRWQRSLFGAKLPVCVQIWIVEMLSMKMGNSCKQLLNPPELVESPSRRISCCNLAKVYCERCKKSLSRVGLRGKRRVSALAPPSRCQAQLLPHTPTRWFMQRRWQLWPPATIATQAPNECTPNCCTSIDSRSLSLSVARQLIH